MYSSSSLRDVLARVARAEQRADELLLEHGEEHGRDGDAGLAHGVDVGDDDLAALAAQPERLAEHVAVADAAGHDDLVEAAVPGGLAQRGQRVVDGCVRVRGAELHRLLALELDRVDGGDDARRRRAWRPGWRCCRCRRQPTTATVSPGCTSAAYTAEPQPVTTPQPSRQALSSGRSLSILMQLASCTTVWWAKVPSAPMPSARSLPSVSWWRAVPSLSCRPVAVMAPMSHRLLWPRGAAGATAAGGHEAEHDVVAGGHAEHAVADLQHDAGTLVAADQRRLGGGAREVAGHQVLVAVAHAAGDDLHQHLAGLGRIEFDLLDAPRCVASTKNCGLGLHGCPRMWFRRMRRGARGAP